MLIVTGATGQLGRAIVEKLLVRVPAEDIGVSVRDPGKAADLMDRGVRVRRGDFDDPASLGEAFEGASQVLIISTDSTGPMAVRGHANAIEAAAQAGAQRILYTSHVGARADSPFPPMPDHAATEAALRGSGVPFTSLRNGFYADSALQLIARGLQVGEVCAPEDGKVAWTTHDDLAAAAALLLSGETRFHGATPPLTAPEALDLADLTAIASELTGRQIRRVTIPDRRWREDMISHGAPEDRVEMLLGLFRAARRGDFAAVDPALETALGHRPQTMRDVLSAAIHQSPDHLAGKDTV